MKHRLGVAFLCAAQGMSAQAVKAGHAGATWTCWHSPLPGLRGPAEGAPEESLLVSSQARDETSPHLHVPCRQSYFEWQILSIYIFDWLMLGQDQRWSPPTLCCTDVLGTTSPTARAAGLTLTQRLVYELCNLVYELNSSPTWCLP